MHACSTIRKASYVQRLVREHPELVELDFTGYKVSLKNTIALTQQLNSLKWLRFQLNDAFEYDRLVTELAGSPWQSSIGEGDYWLRKIITLER